jgi:hypothetical protein
MAAAAAALALMMNAHARPFLTLDANEKNPPFGTESLVTIILFFKVRARSDVCCCDGVFSSAPLTDGHTLQNKQKKLFFAAHVAFLGHALGHGLFCKLIASLFLLAEASAPVYVIFDKQFESLQRRLFDQTLAAKGYAQVPPLEAADREHLNALAQRRSTTTAAAAAGAGSSSAAAALAWRAAGLAGALGAKLLNPKPKEGKALRTTRKALLLLPQLLVPPLVPLFALLEGHTEAVALSSRYLDRKGVVEPGAQEAVAARRAGEYRRCGCVLLLFL